MNDFVPLEQLASELGVHRTNARRIAHKLGFEPIRRQIADLGHRQRTLCWSRSDADRIVAERRRQGFEVPGQRGSDERG